MSAISDQKTSTRSQLYWNTLIRIPSQAFSLIISIYVSRLLDPKDFGVMGIVMMLVGYSNLVTSFGFGEAIIQQRIHDGRVLHSIFTLNLTISIVLASVFVIFSGWIAGFFSTPECEAVFGVMSLVFIITSFSAIPAAILKRDMRYSIVSLMETLGNVLMNLLTLALAIYGYGYWALALGQLISALIVTVGYCVATRWIPAISFKFNVLKGIAHFGIWNMMKTQVGFMAQHADKFIIGKWLGAGNLGLYDKAMSLSEMPYHSLIININSVLFSSFSRLKDDLPALRDQFMKSLLVLSLVNCPIYLGLIAVAPQFVNVLLGEKWAPMVPAFEIILAGMLVKSFGGMMASLNVGAGQYRIHTIKAMQALAVFIACSALAIPYGIEAIAISFCLYSVVQIIMWTNISLVVVNLGWFDVLKSIAPGALAGMVMLVATVSLSHWLFTSYSVLDLLSLVACGMALYSLCVLFDRSVHVKNLRLLVWRDLKVRLISS